MGKNMKKNTYITESLCCTPEIQHCKSTVLQEKKKDREKERREGRKEGGKDGRTEGNQFSDALSSCPSGPHDSGMGLALLHLRPLALAPTSAVSCTLTCNMQVKLGAEAETC